MNFQSNQPLEQQLSQTLSTIYEFIVKLKLEKDLTIGRKLMVRVITTMRQAFGQV